ncbi:MULTISPECIES: hypothetical protein [unclassified Streptomyces]|uniref:hypothetical protein n=1 Tax=unclassified Streptomyces TaxID=2593676 RepID=UPI00340DA2DA
MTETEMMQRVVAILTQAKDMSDALDEDRDREDLNPESEMVGQLIAETLDFDAITVTDTDPQAVADTVAKAMTSRVGLLTSCLIAAFCRLADHHDVGDTGISSAEVLQRLALEWEMDGEGD